MSERRMFNELPVPLPANADYKKQSAPVPGTERPGHTAIYRNSVYPLQTLETPGVFTNLIDVFDEGFRRSKGGPFLGHRPIVSKQPLTYTKHFVWESWSEVDARRRAVGSALNKLFKTKELVGGQYDTVGIWSKNCPNWFVVDLACQAYNKVSVSLYDTLGADSVEYIINHADLSVVFAAPEHLPFLLTLADKVPSLKMVISLQPLDNDEEKRVLSAWAKSRNITFMDLSELEEFGRANLIPPIPATSDTMATICYTSGTSGMPKGVLLTHGSMALSVYSFEHGHTIEEDRTTLSFLPLAHVFQRVMDMCTVAEGKCIGYATGDPLRLLEDIQILKPHFVALVPRILNRIYQSAMVAGAAPGVKGSLFRRAVATKLHQMHTTGKRTHLLWDRLVFSKLNSVFGGRMVQIACGSAPFSKEVAEFLKIALVADIREGYGMTENCACSTVHWSEDTSAGGTIGAVHPASEIKLIDVPDLGYRVTDKPFPRGELLMRGGARAFGYFKDEKKTLETFDEEGWLHSGDVATIDAHGRFKIIDRVKNIMKLAQGEYVALEHVEHTYSGCPLVGQLFVYGDSFQSFLVAVVVPDPAGLVGIVQRVLKESVDPADVHALQRYVQDPRIVSAVLTELDKESSVQKLKGFEKVKRIHLTLDAFSVENGCLTPTFKLRRKETYEKFKPYIDALYALPDAHTKL